MYIVTIRIVSSVFLFIVGERGNVKLVKKALVGYIEEEEEEDRL